jgi:hypothetical protein
MLTVFALPEAVLTLTNNAEVVDPEIAVLAP